MVFNGFGWSFCVAVCRLFIIWHHRHLLSGSAINLYRVLDTIIWFGNHSIITLADYEQSALNESLIFCSINGEGNWYENAVCESFFHALKIELIYQHKYEFRAQANRAEIWQIKACHIRARRHSGIEYQSSINFEIQTEIIAWKTPLYWRQISKKSI